MEDRMIEFDNKMIRKLVIIGVAAIATIILIFSSFSIVGPTDRGVLVRFGAVTGEMLNPGLKIKIPFVDRVKKYSIAPREMSIKVPVGEDGAITKDNQTVGADIGVFWAYDDSRILDIAKGYAEDRLKEMMTIIAKNAIKSTIGKYDIYSLATSQAEISNQIEMAMIANLHEYPVKLVDVKLTNFDWSDAFDQRIEETMQATQEVRIAEQQREIITVKADTQVIETRAQTEATILKANAEYEAAVRKAEGEKQAMVLKAEGEKEQARFAAEAKVLEGEAIKQYNQAIKENIETELKLRELENERARIDRWDGQYVPNNMYGPIPVDTVGGILGK